MRWILIGVGCLAALIHSANLLYLARATECHPLRFTCSEGDGPWIQADTGGYLRLARQIREKGLPHASLHRRAPGYPLLLEAGRSLTGARTAALWFVPPLAGFAAAGIAWMAGALSGRRRAAVAAGLLFCAWPPIYGFAPILQTDAVHGLLVAIAAAASLWWRRDERPAAAALAAATWLVAQSIRHTFFPLALILPVLLWKRGASRPYAALSCGLWLATLLVPAFVIEQNRRHHDAAIPTVLPYVNLACYAVPRLKEDLGLGDFRALRVACGKAYRDLPLGERVRAQRRDGLAFLLAHPGPAVRSHLRELADQLFYPPRPWHDRPFDAHYPRFATTRSPVWMASFWLLAALGLAFVWRRDRAFVLFTALAFALVMGPATNSHWVKGRLRLPVELWLLPLAAVGVDRLLTGGGAQLRERCGASRRSSSAREDSACS